VKGRKRTRRLSVTEKEPNLRETLKKLLRTVKAVLLSFMDYQVELEEMKTSRFKLIFAVLIIATVTYAVAFYIWWELSLYIFVLLLVGWMVFILSWLTRR
jgi:ABC-type multidrug transport system fused ATPase/permease subunit